MVQAIARHHVSIIHSAPASPLFWLPSGFRGTIALCRCRRHPLTGSETGGTTPLSGEVKGGPRADQEGIREARRDTRVAEFPVPTGGLFGQFGFVAISLAAIGTLFLTGGVPPIPVKLAKASKSNAEKTRRKSADIFAPRASLGRSLWKNPYGESDETGKTPNTNETSCLSEGITDGFGCGCDCRQQPVG